ncbi:MAG TPA: Uma2 family endonuclease [Blastocatellia bacterium]|nr:Uma2 family endonuclease [Blastocatellia bacterium]
MGQPQTKSERQSRYTVEEYLAKDRASEGRYEYLDGFVYAMAGESGSHADICTNLTIAIGAQLRGQDCRARSKDTKVRSARAPEPGTVMKGLFSYPDLVVVCGEPQYMDDHRDVLLNPSVIVEVLSDSTEAYDRGEKFRRYRESLPTLTDYLLVSQDRPVIDHYRRGADDEWVLVTYFGLDTSLRLDSINCAVNLADLYDRIEFPSEAELREKEPDPEK